MAAQGGEQVSERASLALSGFSPPTSDLEIVQLNATVAEHWLYLPSVGFLLFLGGCALDLPRKFGAGPTATAAIAILALSVRSTIRSSDWRNKRNFTSARWRRVALSRGSSVNLGRFMLTVANML